MKRGYGVFKYTEGSWKIVKVFEDKNDALEYICNNTLSDKLSDIIFPRFQIQEDNLEELNSYYFYSLLWGKTKNEFDS